MILANSAFLPIKNRSLIPELFIQEIEIPFCYVIREIFWPQNYLAIEIDVNIFKVAVYLVMDHSCWDLKELSSSQIFGCMRCYN